MKYSKKIFACFFGIVAFSSLQSIYAEKIDITKHTQNESNRYILKLNDANKSTIDGYNRFNEIFIKKFGKNNFELRLLVNNTYLLTINYNKIKKNRSVSHKYIQNLLEELRSDPALKYITKDRIGVFNPVPEPNYDHSLVDIFNVKFKINDLTNNSLDHSAQWDEFQAPEGVLLESKPNTSDGAWSYTNNIETNPGLSQTTVAVLDTGIEYNDNLAYNIVKHPNTDKFFGWNFSTDDNDLSDSTEGYHGTHVAGTIAANGPNIMGMGPLLKVLPVKICDSSGMFYESNVIRGIYWAIGEPVDGVPLNIYPAKVINMSFGIDEYVGKEVDECSPAVQEAIDYARDKGVVVVVAAGNSNKEHDLGSPGGCKGTIRVASTGPTGLRSYFSNYGSGISFSAPGGDKRFGQAGGILSTVKAQTGINNTGFDYYQGTSMASPHVAGLAGLVYSVSDSKYDYTAKQVEKILYTTTHDFGKSFEEESACVGSKSCGHGIINAKNAVEAAIANYDNLFSSPSFEFLDLKEDQNCKNGKLSPSKDKIIKPEGTWVLDETSKICQSQIQYTHPVISFDAEKYIVKASYGHVIYNLDLSTSFSFCHQVGYDGMGCYR